MFFTLGRSPAGVDSSSGELPAYLPACPLGSPGAPPGLLGLRAWWGGVGGGTSGPWPFGGLEQVSQTADGWGQPCSAFLIWKSSGSKSGEAGGASEAALETWAGRAGKFPQEVHPG